MAWHACVLHIIIVCARLSLVSALEAVRSMRQSSLFMHISIIQQKYEGI